ncbi:MAG: hypothetical protein Fur005_06700 [Roseiflexaceae bacterium]
MVLRALNGSILGITRTTSAGCYYFLVGNTATSRIEVIAPPGRSFSTANAPGVAETLDSDVDPFTWMTPALNTISPLSEDAVGAGIR